eukprot:TRINITY_DN10786_c0_g1_i1.p1 TRINITY_DN10786_c0_g1~~TRINITY_DN10786_c0_g1_i1.p1  ORF type:complete len:515 (+),score=111.54 TRINITY_DN10786_c0_g1_i1:75-1547(+)
MSLGVRLESLCDFNKEAHCCTNLETVQDAQKKEKCIKRVEIREDGRPIEVHDDGSEHVLPKTKVDLHDCLGCNGCVTEDGEDFVQRRTSWEAFLNVVEESQNSDRVAVLSISPQSRASLASHFNLSQEEFLSKLTTLMKSKGVDHIFDTSIAAEISLVESAKEFIARKKSGETLPVICGSCPGFVAFAEKSHSYLLDHLSTVKSSQQIMGELVKGHFAKSLSLSPTNIIHATVMPCTDRRAEATRKNHEEGTGSIDYVLTSQEFVKMSEANNFALPLLDSSLLTENPFLNLSSTGMLTSLGGGSSDGYLEYIFKAAASELYQVEVSEIKYVTKRSGNFKETSLEVGGETVLRCATAYGFRNIVPLLRVIKRGKGASPYDYLEVMACPGGCLNGGGQVLAPSPSEGPRLLESITSLYDASPSPRRSAPSLLEPSVMVGKLLEEWKLHTPNLLSSNSPHLHTSFSPSVRESTAAVKKSCKCGALDKVVAQLM